MQNVLTEIISLLTGGITGVAQGIGTGLAELTQQVFLTGTGTEVDPYKLSVFGGVVIVFAGVSLAVGLSKMVVNWIQSLGN